MSNEAIEKIKAAEKDAERIVSEARRKASDIRKRADEDALENEAKAKNAAALYMKKSAENAEAKSEQVISDGIESARSDAKKCVSGAEEKIHTASESVIRGIFEKWQ